MHAPFLFATLPSYSFGFMAQHQDSEVHPTAWVILRSVGQFASRTHTFACIMPVAFEVPMTKVACHMHCY